MLFTSVVRFHEQVTGWNAYLNKARDSGGVVRAYRMFQRILSDFAAADLLPFDDLAADYFDRLRSQKVRIPTMDLRIASIAISRGATLLTRNLTDFRQVPGLHCEDWTS